MNRECFHCDFVSNFYQVLCLHILGQVGALTVGMRIISAPLKQQKNIQIDLDLTELLSKAKCMLLYFSDQRIRVWHFN